jgi:CubicO group peptidase (beta-lactamase class C family)
MKRLIIGLAAGILLTITPAAQAEPLAEPTPAAIDAYLGKAMDSLGLPGMSVVVTRGDKVVHAAGYGHDSAGRPVTASTPMRVASISKSFTAMAVMTLVDDGKISLDEPLAAQLPEFRLADQRAARITVRQLLNQTSGLSDTTVDIGATQSAKSLAEYVSTLGTATLAADPGTRWEYCNVNYDVAARLVEVVAGKDFGDYLAAQVFGPLGMTGSAVSDQVVKPSEGYNSLYGAWIARPELPGFLSGAGGVITDAADMGEWLISQAGNGKRLVTPASLKTMHTTSAVGNYGMGWGTDGDPGLLVHAGNLFTYTATEGIAPETGYGFAVMTNSAALYDDTNDVLLGLVALSRGQVPGVPGGGRQLIELVLGLVGLVAIGLGVLGVLRSRRWANRRAGSAGRRVALRLVPLLLPGLLFAAYPDLVSYLTNGRTVTWAQLTYFAAPLSITFLIVAVAGVVAAVARLRALVSAR